MSISPFSRAMTREAASGMTLKVRYLMLLGVLPVFVVAFERDGIADDPFLETCTVRAAGLVILRLGLAVSQNSLFIIEVVAEARTCSREVVG
jgi:hypothetical protein